MVMRLSCLGCWLDWDEAVTWGAPGMVYYCHKDVWSSKACSQPIHWHPLIYREAAQEELLKMSYCSVNMIHWRIQDFTKSGGGGHRKIIHDCLHY